MGQTFPFPEVSENTQMKAYSVFTENSKLNRKYGSLFVGTKQTDHKAMANSEVIARGMGA